MSSFRHPRVDTNLYELLSSAEHKRRHRRRPVTKQCDGPR